MNFCDFVRKKFQEAGVDIIHSSLFKEAVPLENFDIFKNVHEIHYLDSDEYFVFDENNEPVTTTCCLINEEIETIFSGHNYFHSCFVSPNIYDSEPESRKVIIRGLFNQEKPYKKVENKADLFMCFYMDVEKLSMSDISNWNGLDGSEIPEVKLHLRKAFIPSLLKEEFEKEVDGIVANSHKLTEKIKNFLNKHNIKSH